MKRETWKTILQFIVSILTAALIGIIGSENDTVDAESLLGTLKGDFRHNAAGGHHHILVLEVVGYRVLHLHLIVLDPCKTVVNPVDDEREVFATMAENHSQLGELVEGAVQNQSQRRLHGIQSETKTWRRIHIAHILHILVVGSLRMNIDGTAQLLGLGQQGKVFLIIQVLVHIIGMRVPVFES